MIEDFKWDVEPHRLGSELVGSLELAPGIKFRVERWGAEAATNPTGVHYHIKYDVFGYCFSKDCLTKREVEQYLRTQEMQLELFAELKAKRDAIQNRIVPLQKKFQAIGKQIFDLLR